MRKNNPYYKRGRPSQQALDWEVQEDIAERRGKLINSTKEIIKEGIMAGATGRCDMYENGEAVYTFYYDFFLVPASEGNDTLKYKGLTHDLQSI